MGLTTEIGNRGEELAAEYLTRQGFEIVERNYRSGRYEIDIIAVRGDVLHIVEVKTRRAGSLTTPEDAITPSKFRSLCVAANAYIAQITTNYEVQFDLVAVETNGESAQIRYIANAMYARW